MQPFWHFILKHLSGLLVFIISGAVYFTTMAPTVSFWDCGEFISSAAYLQVPHPPGAPFYLLLARFFSLFAGEPGMVAFFVNLLSVVASAATVWLLYQILKIIFTQLAAEHHPHQVLIREAAAMIGALLFAFTDSFWSSAVEAEIYALSLFFSTLTIWVFLRWFTLPSNYPGQARWFFLGVFLVGLSLGVHLLNLLLAPAVALLFGWKVFGRSFKVTLWSLTMGLLILGAVYIGLIQNGLWLAGHLELLLVNKLHWFKHSGVVLWYILFICALASGVLVSFRRYPAWHLALVTVVLLLFGWSSYLLIPLRASAGPAINMNAPGDVFSLESYINREQYGDRPLIRGVHAWARPQEWGPSYQSHFNPDSSFYEKRPSGLDLQFSESDYVWFPRLCSRQPHHVSGYEWWMGQHLKPDLPPAFSDEVNFFLQYQMGHMYLRYLFWNFVGRQNDEQGHGSVAAGNWASGINIVDRYFLGNRQWPLPTELFNAAANHYYGIPLLLALLGLAWLLRNGRHRRSTLVLLGTLFFFTGPAIVLYLNQPPLPPRERDYIFTGSFMIVSIFAAIGIFGLLKLVAAKGQSLKTTWLMIFLLTLAGPGLLFSANLNDHNRSGRYLARDMAVSQLRSCPPNAILFTYGDNDTYPLWYAQQVEKVRPDVRLVNLGLLNTPWYVGQQRWRQADNPGLKFNLSNDFYQKHTATLFQVITSEDNESIDAAQLFQGLELSQNNQSDASLTVAGVLPGFLETTIDSNDTLRWNITTDYLSSGELALIDIVSANAHAHPICFTRNTETSELTGLSGALEEHGMVWRLSGIKDRLKQDISLNHRLALFTDSIHLNVNRQVWFDHTCREALKASEYREASIALAQNLITHNRNQEAKEVLKKSMAEWPLSPYQRYDQMLSICEMLAANGAEELSNSHLEAIYSWSSQEFFFYHHSGYDANQLYSKYRPLFDGIIELAEKLNNTSLKLRLEQELLLQNTKFPPNPKPMSKAIIKYEIPDNVKIFNEKIDID